MSQLLSLNRLYALIVKESHQIVRDPSSILISVILPLLLLFIYGFGVSLDLDHLRIGLVLEDRSPIAMSFAKSLTDSTYFDVTVETDIAAFQKSIIAGKIRGIVVVPSYFTAFLYRKDRAAPIQIISDGSEPNTANFVKNYVTGAFQTWLKIENQSNHLQGLLDIQVNSRYWYNPELESRNSLIPGSLALIMALVGTLLTALVVAREWERGTMESLMSTPVSIVELTLGKIIPYFFLALATMALCFIVAVFFYQVPFRGSLIALFLVSSTFLFTALGQGLLISTIAKNQFIAGQMSMFSAFLPAFMLSGFIFEIKSMPVIIQYFTYVLSARYFVSALQTLFLVGNVWQLLIIDIIAMFIIGLIFCLLVTKMSVKRLE